MSSKFTTRLLQWHKDHPRTLPWKEDNDPYKTWVSEIIMQQTRVIQGTPYYLKFIKTFPTVDHLADATEEKVLKTWEGLGYYSRARNMHFTAKLIQEKYNSELPNTYDELLALKGIGPYTAAAIASFCFGLSYPVVDGNVLRVISRFFGIEDSIDDTKTKKDITLRCEKLIIKADPANFNQAIMNFGAIQCTPAKPNCTDCYLSPHCIALKQDKVFTLPKRTKKTKQRNRYFVYFIVNDGKSLYLRQRKKKDIWQGLYEYPMIEKDEAFKIDLKSDLETFFKFKFLNSDQMALSKIFKQKLSHQTIFSKFLTIELKNPKAIDSDIFKIKNDEIRNYSYPRTILNYLKSNSQTTLF